MKLSRRFLIAIAAFASGLPLAASASQALHPAEPGVTDKEILIGQSVDLTGPVSDAGQDLSTGARAYFESLNEKGGIYGRRIRLITMDDGYQVANTVKNVQKLLEEDRVFALFTIQGTPHTAAVVPMTQKDQVPIYTPFSGAQVLREPALPNLFNVRASYADETEKLVQHLTTVGIKRIAVAYQDNAFGKDGLAGAEKAMQKRSKQLVASASILNDASDAEKAAATIFKAEPEAIIMVTAGKPTPGFIKAYNRLRRGVQFYATSVMATQATIQALGQEGVGVVIATVVPFPWSQSSPLTKEYQAAMQKIGKTEYSFISFEGYINAKVFCEALQLAGREPTRAKLIAATEKIHASYGGFGINYGPGVRQGSRLVELTIIGSNQKFIK